MGLRFRSWVGLGLVCTSFGVARVLSACSGDDSGTQDASTDTTVGCATNLTSCSGTCVNVMTDPQNCSACGKPCKSGEVCNNGQCLLTCGGGSFKCDSGCTDLLGDPANCGGCGVTCDPGFVCADGGCALSCQGGYHECPNDAGVQICVNEQQNDYNCGACGSICEAGTRCEGGTCNVTCQDGLNVCSVDLDAGDGGVTTVERCTDFLVDPNNCGGCGNVCEGGTFCSPTDDAGDASCGLGCFGGSLLCGGRCVDPRIDPYNCGGCNKACDGGSKCVDSGCQ